MTGLRAALEFPTLEACPVANASAETEAPITSISWASETEGTVREEFTAGEEFDPDTVEGDVEPVFDYDATRVYQFERETDTCLCEYVEDESYPITDVRAEAGALVVTLHLDSRAALQDVVTTLKDRFGTVRVRYLLQDGSEADDRDVVPVDRGRLTDRQREVLAAAYELGYFDSPRRANATEVAEELDIDVSTFTEHLAAAQSTLMEDLLTA
jgi:predicted DNA binding protein